MARPYRKPPVALVGILWIVAIALLVALWILYDDTRLSHRQTGFPYMPLYGAMTWWFFFVIPLIGWTWGVFNDLKDDGISRDPARAYEARRPEDGKPYR
jgi:hypothetical protein